MLQFMIGTMILQCFSKFAAVHYYPNTTMKWDGESMSSIVKL